jgi:integrase
MKISSYQSKRLNRKMWKLTGHFPHFGRRTRINFSSAQDAREAANQLWQEGQRRAYGLIPPDAPRVTVKQLVERRKPGVRPQAGRVLEKWAATLPVGTLVTELTTSHFRDFADARLREVAPRTVFRELTDVFSMLNSAGEYFPALADWRAPKRPKVAVPEGSREAVFSPESVARVVAHLLRPREKGEQLSAYESRVDCADWFRLALMTGMRPKELRTRKWSDVNFHWHTLRVDRTKTNREGVITISPACARILKERQERVGRESEYVFFWRRAPHQPMKRFTTDILKDACEAVGLKWGYKDPSGVVLYTTRHTAASAIIESGVGLAGAQELLGHTKKTMTMRYGHASRQSRERAAAALDVFAEPLSGLLSKNSEPSAANAANAAGVKRPRKAKTRRIG